MGVGQWYIEKETAQKCYDANKISEKIYEIRTRYAIGMIYKWGDKNDKVAAGQMAKAHGYNINELINEVS